MIVLARVWHERVLADPIVAHAFHASARLDHIERLAADRGETRPGRGEAIRDTAGRSTVAVVIRPG